MNLKLCIGHLGKTGRGWLVYHVRSFVCEELCLVSRIIEGWNHHFLSLIFIHEFRLICCKVTKLFSFFKFYFLTIFQVRNILFLKHALLIKTLYLPNDCVFLVIEEGCPFHRNNEFFDLKNSYKFNYGRSTILLSHI